MKKKYLKHIFSAAFIMATALGNVSCINDLDISSIDPQTSPAFDQASAFVKQYAMLGLTGQQGLAGKPDLDGQDEGESGFYRTTFNCQELFQPTYRMGLCTFGLRCHSNELLPRPDS